MTLTIETEDAVVEVGTEIAGYMSGWCKRIRPPESIEEMEQDDDWLWLHHEIHVYWKD